jgi:uncharacterized protein (TIGR00255 family)
MIKSMTGYGKTEAKTGSRKISVEIRTLNSKQLDLNVKLPAIYRRVEFELRSLASPAIGRGKADVYITLEDSSPSAGIKINRALFGNYYRQIKDTVKEVGMTLVSNDIKTSGMISLIMKMPDVMVSETSEASDEELGVVTAVLKETLAALDEFRIREGEVLIADILARVAKIESLLGEVAPFEKARIEAIRGRILERIAQLGVQTDTNRLEQELVYYVEKLDVTEEKVRLANHCAYFRQTALEESAGRKLGFIAQEMGREINTLGSKANDSGMQKIVVEMKDELEKIKEQLLNIL